jgi:hypothetical protein
MKFSRRTFLASFAGALAMPRLALPQPAPGMREQVADDLVVFYERYDNSVIGIRLRVVLVGALAKQMLEREPHLWSAVMVKRRLT